MSRVMKQRRRLSVLLCAASLLLAPLAQASEPSAADSESALQLYKEGKALRDGGDVDGALQKLRAAYALVETPITALELGRTYIMAGQLVEARGVLLSVARIPVRTNESAKATDARATAESLAGELRPRLASLTVHPKGPAGPTPPRISIDGVVIPPDAQSAPRMLNPGAHVVVLEVGEQHSQADVTLAEGQTKDLDIDLPPPPLPSQTVKPLGPAPPPSDGVHLHPLVYVGFGTAAVGIVVGTVTGILTLSKTSTLDSACPNKRCPSTSQSDIDAANTTGTISTVSFIVGGVGAAAGVVGLFLSRSSTESPTRTAAFTVRPTGDGIAGTF